MNPETQRLFEQLILDKGLVAPEKLAEAKGLQGGDAASPPRDLLEILIEGGYGARDKLREMARLAALRSGNERINIGGFELLEKIGQGGMGSVYRATQVSIGRNVALKLMKPKLARDRRHLERFLREARATARLSHPNIIQGIDAGQDKGYYYFAMEFVDGETLRRAIDREGTLPEDRCIRIGIQIAQALDHAAKLGIVHRDIKPENIMLEYATGIAKLADLGLVKSAEPTDTSVTQAGVAIGTPNYISPEQARGEEKIDIRSDMYSLGATLYHAATGTLPFKGESAPIVLSHHMSTPLEPPHIRNPQVSIRFSRVIQKMMAKKPDQRYQTPAELVADLERVARGEHPAAAMESAVHHRHREDVSPKSRRPKLAAAIAVGSFAVALALGFLLVSSLGPPARPDDTADTHEACYQKAVELVGKSPENFRAIAENVRRCLEAQPDGPRAEAAAAILQTAETFGRLAERATSSPDDWAAAARELTALAASAPKDPPYGESIRRHVRTLARELLSRAGQQAAVAPWSVPEQMRWVDAVLASAPDTEVAAEAGRAKREIADVLDRHADQILDRHERAVAPLVKEGRFGEAIQQLRSLVPADLATPHLRETLDKRVAAILELASRHLAERREWVWQSLDRDRIDLARGYVAELENDLGVSELAGQVRELSGLVSDAERFLEKLRQLDAIASQEPADPRAVAEGALALQKEFGGHEYVRHRLRRYEDAVKAFLAENRVEQMLAAAEQLVAEGKQLEREGKRSDAAAKLGSADAAIAALLGEPGITLAQQQRAVALRQALGPVYGLARIMSAALKQRSLPTAELKLRLEEGKEPVLCCIIDASETTLRLRAGENTLEVAWPLLGHRELFELARGELRLVADDNPNGLYYLGACLVGRDPARGKALLQAAVALAEKKTDEELPGRSALLGSARELLARLREAEAEAALSRLAAAVQAASGASVLDRVVAAWEQFKADYGDTECAGKNEEKLRSIGAELTDAIVRVRAGASIFQHIEAGEWDVIVSKLETVLAETDRISPLTGPRRRNIESLVRFGKAYLVEATVYQKAFATRPWQGLGLAALKEHESTEVAARAERYSQILAIPVSPRVDAEQQRIYAVRVRQGERWEYIQDVDVRLARYNAVFTYWRKEREHCGWAEIDAARDFRYTGGSGNAMAILMLSDFLRARRATSKSMSGQAEFERLQAFLWSAGQAEPLRLFVIQKATALMSEYRGVDDFPARFCLVAGEESLHAGDVAARDKDDEAVQKHYDAALRFFEKLIDPRSPHKEFVWRGHLGRGGVRERREQYTMALLDYETALRRSTGWYNGYRCARAITELCLHSGKLDKPANARDAVAEVTSRTEDPDYKERTQKLLEER